MNKERINNVAQHGVLPDLPSTELAPNAWTAGQNIRVSNGSIGSRLGHVEVFDPPTVAPWWCYPIRSGTAYFWAYAGSAKIYATDGNTHSNITRQDGVPADVDYSPDANHGWNGGVLAGVLVANNGVDEPQAWVSPALGTRMQDFSDATDWDATHTCKVIRPYNNYLIALDITKNTTRYPYMVKWNAPSDPGTINGSWDETDATVDAGENNLIKGGGYLIDGLSLRDSFIIYRETSTWVMNYVGGTFIFDFEELFESIGLLAPNCAVEYKGLHYIISQGDIIAHDGHTPKSIADKKVRKAFFAGIDSDNYLNCFVTLNKKQEEVLFCYPSTGSTYCDKAWVFGVTDGSWTPRDLPDVYHIQDGIVSETGSTIWSTDTENWNEDTTTWDESFYNPTEASLLMCGTGDTKLYKDGEGDSNNGTAFTSYVERTGLQIGDYQSVTHVNSIIPRIEANIGTQITVQVGGQMHPQDSITWTPAYTFTVGTSNYIPLRSSGRFTAIKFSSSASARWNLSSYDIEYDEGGIY
jgi:hypothetical protein